MKPALLRRIVATLALIMAPLSVAQAQTVPLEAAFDQAFGTEQRALRDYTATYADDLSRQIALIADGSQGRIGVFAVDLAMLVGMYVIAVKSRRWWPLWVAAFQLNSVAAHLATVLSPAFSAAVYNGFEGLWAFPGQILMVYGIWRDRVGEYRFKLS